MFGSKILNVISQWHNPRNRLKIRTGSGATEIVQIDNQNGSKPEL